MSVTSAVTNKIVVEERRKKKKALRAEIERRVISGAVLGWVDLRLSLEARLVLGDTARSLGLLIS